MQSHIPTRRTTSRSSNPAPQPPVQSAPIHPFIRISPSVEKKKKKMYQCNYNPSFEHEFKHARSSELPRAKTPSRKKRRREDETSLTPELTLCSNWYYTNPPFPPSTARARAIIRVPNRVHPLLQQGPPLVDRQGPFSQSNTRVSQRLLSTRILQTCLFEVGWACRVLVRVQHKRSTVD
jgi:hypothetical protein